MSDCVLKVVKSCGLTSNDEPVEIKNEKLLCEEEISTYGDENFLNNVDESVLFVDDLIEIKPKFVAVEKQELELELNIQERPAIVTDCSVLPLEAQIVVPIQNVDSLLFDEIFMISEGKTESSNTSRLIPSHNEINETGSICVMAEKLDNGNILVYYAAQLLEGGVNVSQDVLSVIDENLKLVHEKIVVRTCVEGKIVVSLKFENVLRI